MNENDIETYIILVVYLLYILLNKCKLNDDSIYGIHFICGKINKSNITIYNISHSILIE